MQCIIPHTVRRNRNSTAAAQAAAALVSHVFRLFADTEIRTAAEFAADLCFTAISLNTTVPLMAGDGIRALRAVKQGVVSAFHRHIPATADISTVSGQVVSGL